MRIVIAPDSYKSVLSAPAVAEAIAAGINRARPDAECIRVPMADGGEGTLDILVDCLGGKRRKVSAHDPLGNPIEVIVGLINDASTAVVELAGVSGFALVPPDRRDPLKTTTRGLGEVLRTVLDAEMEDIILAVGGSATVDGGAGMMQALGLTAHDAEGRIIDQPLCGGLLSSIGRITWADPPANLEDVCVTIACDVLNPACGPQGAAAVFGPQKGADAAAVRLLEQGLSRWADLLEVACGRPLRHEPGTGAAGGVALPLLAFTSGTIVPGVDLVSQTVGLVGAIADADLVITGEGRIDLQSMMGKVVGAVGRMARTAHVPCIAICGACGNGADSCLEVLDEIVTLDARLEDSACRLSDLAAEVADRYL